MRAPVYSISDTHTNIHSQLMSVLKSPRKLLAGLLLATIAVPVMAQQNAAEPIPVMGYHNFGLRVSDVERSLEFYQGLFGAAVLSRVGDEVALQVGDGPQYFVLAPTREGEQPHISHFGLSVDDTDRYGLQTKLAAHGIERTVDSMGTQTSALNRAMHSWLQRLPGESDTMLADNHALFVADRDGVVFQLSDINSCGGGDDDCSPEPAPAPGLIRLREINHMTTYVSNFELSNDFYRKLFGIDNQAFQGTFPVLGLGNGTQFLMFVGGTQAGLPTQPGRIDHASLNIEDFTEESVLQRLTDYGLSPRVEGQPAAPLQHWVSRRMPERGGAPGGTPEVYFSDPDGIHIQLQHHTYCGGGNEFGGDCGQ
jgi:catechol 2,3-dioxygenase-like lactoylglutathione lyase family enzyme